MQSCEFSGVLDTPCVNVNNPGKAHDAEHQST
jgi:hypothetical protein